MQSGVDRKKSGESRADVLAFRDHCGLLDVMVSPAPFLVVLTSIVLILLDIEPHEPAHLDPLTVLAIPSLSAIPHPATCSLL